MKYFIALLLIGAAIAVNCKAVQGGKTHKLHKAWAEHKAQYHPDLESPEEETELKARFAKTDEMIEKHNSDPNAKHHIGHNHFSTMTNEEKRIHLFGIQHHHEQATSGKSAVDKVEKAWAHHKAIHHPEMDSAEEEAVRKVQFVKTHKMIEEHNSNPEATHLLAHNHYSAMTNEEKKKHFFGVKPAAAEPIESEGAAGSDDDEPKVRRVAAIIPGLNYRPDIPVTKPALACHEKPNAGGPVRCLKQIPRLG